MTHSKYLKWSLGLTIAGTLFAGYLAGTKLFSGTCALNEPCPYFLGYPACFFGFGLFATMLIITIVALAVKTRKQWPVIGNAIVSMIGIWFAGYFTVPEITKLVSGQVGAYSLGLPTCAYGLAFFVIIFILSITTKKV